MTTWGAFKREYVRSELAVGTPLPLIAARLRCSVGALSEAIRRYDLKRAA